MKLHLLDLFFLIIGVVYHSNVEYLTQQDLFIIPSMEYIVTII